MNKISTLKYALVSSLFCLSFIINASPEQHSQVSQNIATNSVNINSNKAGSNLNANFGQEFTYCNKCGTYGICLNSFGDFKLCSNCGTYNFNTNNIDLATLQLGDSFHRFLVASTIVLVLAQIMVNKNKTSDISNQ